MTAKRKLLQAKEVLTALQLPGAQQNDRSCWTLLALANIGPQDAWVTASTPLLRTVDIMNFISEHYGQTYAPNSRETFRRYTLHQFEQARLVDRNRDDPSRPTNSGLNNYSLNAEVVAILHAYPDGDWQAMVGEFLLEVGSLRDQYRQEREMIMVPVRLPDGTAFPDKTAFRQYVADVAWETEVWVADNPDHLVHFNGHKFLGPY